MKHHLSLLSLSSQNYLLSIILWSYVKQYHLYTCTPPPKKKKEKKRDLRGCQMIYFNNQNVSS